ncbi:GNAT family N-acetyltransferase [Phreatobacter stygius]|uniref:N-acetyltransferase n=1 Tax=Phreatobacter stygius TaxID=1940610 RepID=A0A4D7B5B5_9HYPH|nr:GNAT family N-acetyltransferase [Phreatobacter stygius]QCI68191.1 N-acetyltransferase [Phreatobacter stygius]
MSAPPFTIRIVSSLAEIPAADWNACAADETGSVDPFLDHAFFLSLEESGSAVRATGWLGHHLVLEDAAGVIQGVMPCYLKSHSRGEYVFDQGWAEAYEQAGGRYYPKLQVSVPFTPATGRRLLVRAGMDQHLARTALAQGAAQVALQRGVSSLHVTFCMKDEWDLLGAAGYLQRADTQFHFENAGYADFDAFLAALSSRKRKVIRRERREALDGRGITIRRLTGAELTEAAWDAFFAFYTDTGSRKWGRPYLTRAFFSLIGERMADRILLIMAERDGRYIAGAINFIGRDVLYGRHWGCIEEHSFLHFEVCYYQAIEHAIETGLQRVEAGAQGEHKLARGYRPVETHSAHFITDRGLRRAVADYLVRERGYVASAIDELAAMAPFRKAEVESE